MRKTVDFTIVTPTLNQGKYIEQTILSVLDQVGVTIQYIIVDGGSVDETPEILARYRDRVSLIISEPDTGQAEAVRKGFDLAQGDIVGYLNSDDYFLPGALKRVKEIFAKNAPYDLIYGDRIYVDAYDSLLRYWILPRHSNYFMLRWDFIPQEAAFWRRQAMEDVGKIDTSYQFALDYDLFARMMSYGKLLVHVSAFFAVFREHQHSKTTAKLVKVGIPEMKKVRNLYSIKLRFWDQFLAAAYLVRLKIKSLVFLKFQQVPESFQARRKVVK